MIVKAEVVYVLNDLHLTVKQQPLLLDSVARSPLAQKVVLALDSLMGELVERQQDIKVS